MRASEEEGFRQTEAKVRSALEESDAEGASGMLRSFRGSESEAVKKGLAEADSAIRALREDLAALAAARAGDDGARRSFSGIDRARSALQGPGSSRFRRVREEAGRETAALANAEAALARKWAEDGFAVVGPYKGQVGSGEPSDSNPARAVELGRFAIGLREVTGEQYARFVAATGRAAPVGWKGGRPEQGRGLHPVTGVSAEDAEAYCEWLGKEKGGLAVRLPREDEWEIAAGAEFLREGEAPAGKVVDPLREGEAPAEPSIFLPVKLHPYPWGDAFDPVAANLSSGETCEAGAFGKDCSPSGCFDMAGNVCEWTTASPSLWEPSPDGEAAQGKYAVRGGCFADGGSSRSARVAFRQAVPRDTKLSRLGFRVAADVP
jgi:formylglycine-generating enzyme required for sulfatase activity